MDQLKLALAAKEEAESINLLVQLIVENADEIWPTVVASPALPLSPPPPLPSRDSEGSLSWGEAADPPPGVSTHTTVHMSTHMPMHMSIHMSMPANPHPGMDIHMSPCSAPLPCSFLRFL